MTEEGAKFGDYLLLRRIAEGGMAEVFLAREKSMVGIARNVVVKRILMEMTKSPDFVTMFADEARLASRFSHPNVAQIYGFGEIDGVYYISMEHVDGLTVAQLKRRAGKDSIPLEITLRTVSDVCAGLHYVHELTDERGERLGIVHRDVSPQNVMISRDGVIKLIDFGVARAATQVHVTRVSQIKGKLAYMAPEVLVPSDDRQIDRRADIFASGVLLYEMVTGTRLFRRSSEAATVLAVKCDDPLPVVNFGAPAALDAILSKALAKEPTERYQTALEMQDALEELIASSPKIATPYVIGSFLSSVMDNSEAREESFSNSVSRSREILNAAAFDHNVQSLAEEATDLAEAHPPLVFPELPSLDEISDEMNELAATYVDLPIITDDQPMSSSTSALAAAARNPLGELEFPEEPSEIAESTNSVPIPPPPVLTEPPALLNVGRGNSLNPPINSPKPEQQPTHVDEHHKEPFTPPQEMSAQIAQASPTQPRRIHLLLLGMVVSLLTAALIITLAYSLR